MSDTTPAGIPSPAAAHSEWQMDMVQRLARLEDRMDSNAQVMAKREDIEKVKTLIEKKDASTSRWFISITIGAVVTVLAALVRTFVG